MTNPNRDYQLRKAPDFRMEQVNMLEHVAYTARIKQRASVGKDEYGTSMCVS